MNAARKIPPLSCSAALVALSLAICLSPVANAAGPEAMPRMDDQPTLTVEREALASLLSCLTDSSSQRQRPAHHASHAAFTDRPSRLAAVSLNFKAALPPIDDRCLGPIADLHPHLLNLPPPAAHC